MIETYADALAFIHGRHKWKKTASFERIELLLARLGNPHLKSKYVHITGTNGKGSTSKMLAQILRATGLSVGLFTSPFIMRFNERIQDDAGEISDERLLQLMQEIAPVVEQLDITLDGGGPTEFETLTALMFLYFARFPVDIVVLEVGIGGSWDTTNIVPAQQKLATAVTSVSYDHMAVLGDTLAKIAEQKAGILRAGVPVVFGKLPAEATSVMALNVERLGLQASWLGQDFSVHGSSSLDSQTYFDFDSVHTFEQVPLNLRGQYQLGNAGVALRLAEIVLDKLGRSLIRQDVVEALATVTWPARFEMISSTPEVIIDGAHNVAGVTLLGQTIRQYFPQQQVNVIFGALTDKNYIEMLEILASIPNVKLTVAGFQAPTARQAIDPSAVVASISRTNVSAAPNWQVAFAKLSSEQPIIITGSLYFVAEVRARLLTQMN